jgi:hypothetical protein
MSSKRTLTSEAVAGLAIIKNKFVASELSDIQGLTQKHINTISEEMDKSPDYKAIYEVAHNAHGSQLLIGGVKGVRWLGDNKTKEVTSRDLEVALNKKTSVFVSVKMNSNLIWNLAPIASIEDFWNSTKRKSTKAKDFFIEVAKDELNEYFLACEGKAITGYDNVSSFYLNYRGARRKDKSDLLTEKSKTEKAKKVYKKLCHAVSENAAARINANISGLTLNCLQVPLWAIFRLNGTRYILLGIDNNERVCCEVPSQANWEQEYKIVSIVASNANAGQPRVNINFKIQSERTKREHEFKIFIYLWPRNRKSARPSLHLFRNSVS